MNLTFGLRGTEKVTDSLKMKQSTMFYLQTFLQKYSKIRVILYLNLINKTLKTFNQRLISNSCLLWQKTAEW